MMLFKSADFPVGILEDCNVSNDAEVHMTEGDLWNCIEGEVAFICGGELVGPWFGKYKDGNENRNELKAKNISGGWLWIPAGEPHQHNCEKTARLVVIKIPKT